MQDGTFELSNGSTYSIAEFIVLIEDFYCDQVSTSTIPSDLFDELSKDQLKHLYSCYPLMPSQWLNTLIDADIFDHTFLDDINETGFTELVVKTEQGDIEATSELGWCYNNGKSAKQDFNEAKRLFLIAAKEAYPDACFGMGWLSNHGLKKTIHLKTQSIGTKKQMIISGH
ncbi:hypothetical protein [Aliamphritea ceti]|uniref:hypothetical protein n=1 Tax=Aliamphritea ceti TaxID=1524258 RepID=UPI0021C3DA18|nr:hypothetical protein [Aliamphritea ceti]